MGYEVNMKKLVQIQYVYCIWVEKSHNTRIEPAGDKLLIFTIKLHMPTGSVSKSCKAQKEFAQIRNVNLPAVSVP